MDRSDRETATAGARSRGAGERAPRLLPEAQRWAAVHTRARAEKAVAGILDQLSVVRFLPLVLHRHRYGPRVREYRVPLFPGYLFCEAQGLDRPALFASRKVAKVLEPDDASRLRADLENLALALEGEPRLVRTVLGPPGVPVRVVGGPLAGVTGRLVRRERRRPTLVIMVDFVGYGAAVEIDEALVEPA